MVYRKEGNRICYQDTLIFLGKWVESEERAQQIACYTAEGETGELDFSAKMESKDLKLTYQHYYPTCPHVGLAGMFPGSSCWIWGLE